MSDYAILVNGEVVPAGDETAFQWQTANFGALVKILIEAETRFQSPSFDDEIPF